MKMLLVLAPSDCLPEVQEVMERHELHAYTEFPGVHGSGRSGRKLGTRAYPGASSVVLAVLPAAEAERLVGAVRDYAARARCRDEIRIFAAPAEALL